MKIFDNVDQVRAKFFELELVMRNFNEVYDRYYVEFIDESVIRDLIDYFELVKRAGISVFKLFDVWL